MTFRVTSVEFVTLFLLPLLHDPVQCFFSYFPMLVAWALRGSSAFLDAPPLCREIVFSPATPETALELSPDDRQLGWRWSIDLHSFQSCYLALFRLYDEVVRPRSLLTVPRFMICGRSCYFHTHTHVVENKCYERRFQGPRKSGSNAVTYDKEGAPIFLPTNDKNKIYTHVCGTVQLRCLATIKQLRHKKRCRLPICFRLSQLFMCALYSSYQSDET
jgi:hypothetical protein